MFVTNFVTVCPQPQLRWEAGQEARHDIAHLMAIVETLVIILLKEEWWTEFRNSEFWDFLNT